jgi:transcription elongation factor GreB
MSKAFTRESDETENEVLPARSPLPPGVKNYITAGGAQRLRDELSSLLDRSLADKSPAREARIRQLQDILASLVLAEPPLERNTVRFGATVSLQRQNETEKYRLVGVDETDLDRNQISWLSPLGKVLLGKRAGERVRFRSPSGAEELTILSVEYL